MENVTESSMLEDRKIIIRTTKTLDCSAHCAFAQACHWARQSQVQVIIVDLDATLGIRASGLGMLLMLYNEMNLLQIRILLQNCNPEIKAQLKSSKLLSGVSIS
ncbi:MAG: STAS domain-containing protein [Candidatus Thiodiazotropha sp. (ex. Lucinoma kazani)]